MNRKEREEMKRMQEIIREQREELNRRNGVIHFDFDGEITACKRDVYSVESSDNIKDVTCRNCKSAYRRYKLKINKEWQKEKESKRKNK